AAIRRALMMSRSSFLIGLFVCALATAAAGPTPAEAFQQCNMLAAPACNGPMLFTFTNNSRFFSGAGCDDGCVDTAGNAYGPVLFADNIGAIFMTSTDTVGMYQNFDCGARGKCTVRGGDGLPVELLSFGVE